MAAEVRGDTTVIVEEHRPVPLWQSVLVGHRLYDLFIDDGWQQAKVNPELRGSPWTTRRTQGQPGPPQRPAARGAPAAVPDRRARADVVERLDRAGLLPAIVFIFSRAGCDAAVEQCLRRRAAAHLARRARADPRGRRASAPRTSPQEDLAVLGYPEFLDGLERGIAAHHAGMLPVFKEIVEELFTAGLIQAVFATETLALGINMPARSVVLESLVKWNGEAHVDLTPGEYTQLTGRAGRRGIDVEGHGVVLWTPGSTRGSSRAWRRPGPTRCARASGRPTTWPSTSSASSAATRP